VSDWVILFHYIYIYMKSELKGIVKYIEKVYNPSKIKIINYVEFINEPLVSLFFDEISDDFITNPQSNNIKRLKEKNLERQIRKDIYNYFGVMTSGLTLDGSSPYTFHGLTIDVHLRD